MEFFLKILLLLVVNALRWLLLTIILGIKFRFEELGNPMWSLLAEIAKCLAGSLGPEASFGGAISLRRGRGGRLASFARAG